MGLFNLRVEQPYRITAAAVDIMFGLFTLLPIHVKLSVVASGIILVAAKFDLCRFGHLVFSSMFVV